MGRVASLEIYRPAVVVSSTRKEQQVIAVPGIISGDGSSQSLCFLQKLFRDRQTLF